MIQIQPIQILDRQATQLEIRVELKPNADTSTAYYNIRNSERGLIFNGIIQIPIEIHSTWGEDDSVIEDYVLEQLNLQRE